MNRLLLWGVIVALAWIAMIVLLISSAHAYAIKGDTWVFDPEEIMRCHQQGGCAPISKDYWNERLQKAYDDGRASCKGAI